MLDLKEQCELRECVWNVVSKFYKNHVKCLTNEMFDRLNVCEKFCSGHRVFVNIVHKHCSETSFVDNVQSTLFALTCTPLFMMPVNFVLRTLIILETSDYNLCKSGLPLYLRTSPSHLWKQCSKEIIAVYRENHMKPINTKWIVTDCWSRWDI
jgi:hypothetical protein